MGVTAMLRVMCNRGGGRGCIAQGEAVARVGQVALKECVACSGAAGLAPGQPCRCCRRARPHGTRPPAGRATSHRRAVAFGVAVAFPATLSQPTPPLRLLEPGNTLDMQSATTRPRMIKGVLGPTSARASGTRCLGARVPRLMAVSRTDEHGGRRRWAVHGWPAVGQTRTNRTGGPRREWRYDAGATQ